MYAVPVIRWAGFLQQIVETRLLVALVVRESWETAPIEASRRVAGTAVAQRLRAVPGDERHFVVALRARSCRP